MEYLANEALGKDAMTQDFIQLLKGDMHRKPRLWMVDDQEQILKGYKIMAQSRFEIETFTNPIVALSHLKDIIVNEPTKYPDILLVDIYMPETMDGRDFAKEVLSIRDLPYTSIMFLTGEGKTEDDAPAAFNAGINSYRVRAYLRKPLMPNEFKSYMAWGLLDHKCRYQTVYAERFKEFGVEAPPEWYGNDADTLNEVYHEKERGFRGHLMKMPVMKSEILDSLRASAGIQGRIFARRGSLVEKVESKLTK